MAGRRHAPLLLTTEERQTLEQRVLARTGSQQAAYWAQIILRVATGDTDAQIAQDTVSLHHSQEVATWQAAHADRLFQLHFLPVHSSWLSFIEVWFSILSRKVPQARGFPHRCSCQGADRRVHQDLQSPLSASLRVAQGRAFLPMPEGQAGGALSPAGGRLIPASITRTAY